MSRKRRPAGRGGAKGKGRAACRPTSAKGRTASSARWLQRQLRDPYVAEARRRGYPSRAAFKLAELDDRFRFLAPGRRVVDLGAAPGGWTRIAADRVGAGAGGGRVVAVDVSEMAALPGVTVLQGDIRDADTAAAVGDALGGAADVVLSDMAAPATGHAATDHLRVLALCEEAFALACEVLAPGGTFVAKVLQGGTEHRRPPRQAALQPGRVGGDLRCRLGFPRRRANRI